MNQQKRTNPTNAITSPPNQPTAALQNESAPWNDVVSDQKLTPHRRCAKSPYSRQRVQIDLHRGDDPGVDQCVGAP